MITPGQRTFFWTMLAQVVAHIALFVGRLPADLWVSSILGLAAIYSGKSVGETFVKGKQT